MYLCKQEHGFSVFLHVCNLEYLVPLSLHMYKSMLRPEVIRRDELCFFQSCAKLPSLPRTSEIHHVVIPAARSTSVYINLARCVYHCFTFSLVLKGRTVLLLTLCKTAILTRQGDSDVRDPPRGYPC